MKIEISKSLYKLSQLTASKLYLVGGYVRNYLLFGSSENTDMDICGSLSALEMFPASVDKLCINSRLGTYKIIFEEEVFEYTPFRSETYIGGKHVPEDVRFNCDLFQDAHRRDFTVNAIYYDISEDKIIDPVSGFNDLRAGVIRQISEKTLAADGIRLMRAIRFAAQLGFTIDEETKLSIMKFADLINDISSEMIRDELKKILVADTAYGKEYAHYVGVTLLKETGLLKYILPELHACDGVLQNPKYHKYDVLEHIFQTVKYSKPEIRLAALLHDVGKPLCIDSQGHMKGHDIIGSEMTVTIMKRLNFSNSEIEETSKLVRLHMFNLKGEASENKVKLFAVKNFTLLDKIINLKFADMRGCGLKSTSNLDVLVEMKNKILSDGTPLTVKDLEINGNDLIELGAKGAIVGEILENLHRDCIIMPKLNNRNWLLKMAKKMVNIYKV